MSCPASVPFAASRTLHPHALHALAAWHSLTRAWRQLQAAQIAVARSAASDADRGTIQAWKPGSGVSGGTGVGSGLDAAVCETPSVQSAELRFLDEVHEQCSGDVWQACWLAMSDLGRMPGSLDQLATAIPAVAPATARDISSWLSTSDRRLRRVLAMEPDERPIPGNRECPVCTVRMLRVQCSAVDRAAWTIVCAVPCRCSGDGCPCGMPVRESDVIHIWQASAFDKQDGRIAA